MLCEYYTVDKLKNVSWKLEMKRLQRILLKDAKDVLLKCDRVVSPFYFTFSSRALYAHISSDFQDISLQFFTTHTLRVH